ncbi:Uncharacterised protein [BD1-7 clade bacterium]|uniref:Uncharacterized protein n=1 Tax=BD1-7 clade bacterium TaxID=2029982 RepID=A0A5S9NRT4_9GAMM|nr:Uncharacterised protein [BD1-7 clade bacterium]CAA0093223.1 Uncharacterised protein [BD1-7 clade bacterium]
MDARDNFNAINEGSTGLSIWAVCFHGLYKQSVLSIVKPPARQRGAHDGGSG